MPYVYLFGSLFFSAFMSVLGAFYNRKNPSVKSASSLYTLLIVASAFSFWAVLFLTDLTYDFKVIWYALIFGCAYATFNVAQICALKAGPLSLTSLFIQLSLVATAIWGFFFWGSSFTVLVAVGLALVVVSICLCLYDKKKDDSDKKFNFKWLFFTTLAFASTTVCAIVQRNEATAFNGQYGNFFMFMATGLSMLFSLIMFLVRDKKGAISVAKKSWYFPVIAGMFNGLHNLTVIFLASTSLSPSLIYPVLGVGGLIVTSLFSLVVFKEKMKWWQWVGVLVGMVACGILSI